MVSSRIFQRYHRPPISAETEQAIRPLLCYTRQLANHSASNKTTPPNTGKQPLRYRFVVPRVQPLRLAFQDHWKWPIFGERSRNVGSQRSSWHLRCCGRGSGTGATTFCLGRLPDGHISFPLLDHRALLAWAAILEGWRRAFDYIELWMMEERTTSGMGCSKTPSHLVLGGRKTHTRNDKRSTDRRTTRF